MFRTGSLARSATFDGYTIEAGTLVEIHHAFFDINDRPMVVGVADGRRVQLPADFFPKGTLAGMVANDLSR